MKKFLAFSVLLGILGASAFAEITIAGKADMVLMPLQLVKIDDRDDLYLGAGIGRNGADAGPRVRLDVAGNMDDKIGFRAEIRFFDKAGGPVDFGDWANVWWQPLSMLKFDVGRFNADTLRGKVGDDNWNRYTVSMQAEDAIFNRFRGELGALVSLTPIPGLFVGVLVPNFGVEFTSGEPFGSDITLNGGVNHTGAAQRALRVYERTQVGAGYELNGIGLIRAQFVGANGGFDGSDGIRLPLITDVGNIDNFQAPRFELAFAFTSMEGLVIDFGVKAYIPLSDWVTDTWLPADEKYEMVSDNSLYKDFGTIWKGLQFALGAKFNMGAFNIGARVDALNIAASFKGGDNPFTKDFSYNVGPTINFHLWPSYNLGICELGVDFGLNVKLQDTADHPATLITPGLVIVDGDQNNDQFAIGFGLWAKKAYGNGSIKGGLAFRTGNHHAGSDDKITDPMVISVPIIFDYSF